MKKLAVILTGQLRTFDNEIVMKSWDKFRNLFDVDFYVCCWNNRGRSIYSTECGLVDGIHYDEIVDESYVKKIFKTSHVKLYDYNSWKSSEYVSQLIDTYGYSEKYFDPLFAGAFLKKESMNLISGGSYDRVILSRPDCIFIKEPPKYFFENDDIIWHQPWNLTQIIYSTFISSNLKNIKSLCSWYGSENMHKNIHSGHNRYNNILEHCGVMYSHSIELGLVLGAYDGSLFAEPYRSIDDIANYKNFCGSDMWCLI